MQRHWRKFRKDKYYLLRYFICSLIVMSAIVSLQVVYFDFSIFTDFSLSLSGLYLLPLGLIIGVKAPVLIHNCVHGNLKVPWMNQVAGELCGVYVLLGMAAFELNHRMHHVHSDSELDPHNPKNKKFIPFFFANNFGGTEPVLKKFLQFHGDNRSNRLIFGASAFFHFAGVPLRAAFWFFLFGPSLFLTFFLPSYLFHMFVFAHINFITHQSQENGEVIVLNLDSNIYYKFVNFFGSGVYFHKNHHDNPNHYNPQLGASASALFR